MGTSNLTVVIHDSEVKVAQYGQWDGYPTGSGLVVHGFCKEFLPNKRKRNKFIKKLNNVEFVPNEKLENATLEQYPFMSRDVGSNILKNVAESTKKVYLQNSINFAADSLFCEWTYVIDLDRNTLEVYKGFVKDPLKECERFKYLESKSENGYFPVKLIKSFSLNNLISERMYLLELDIDEV